MSFIYLYCSEVRGDTSIDEISSSLIDEPSFIYTHLIVINTSEIISMQYNGHVLVINTRGGVYEFTSVFPNQFKELNDRL